jgi:periplasmic divalent cation tolerance protein
MDDLIEVEVNCPDMAVAEAVARACVEPGLAACANILPGMVSLYRWQGKVERAAEVSVRLKSRAGHFAELAAAVRAVHPYEVPAILALPVRQTTADYGDWIRAGTGGA